MPFEPRGNLKETLIFLGKAGDDPFEQFKRAQAVRQVNEDTRRKNKEQLAAKTAPGGRLAFLTRRAGKR